jgi:hypothetical protein
MTAVQADNRFSRFPIQFDGAYRACTGTIAAAQAEFPPVTHPASPPFTQGAAGTGSDTGRIWAGQAIVGLEACGKPTPGPYAYPGTRPGKDIMHHAGTGKHAGVTADTTLHRYSLEHFRQNKKPLSSFVTSSGLIILQAHWQA